MSLASFNVLHELSLNSKGQFRIQLIAVGAVSHIDQTGVVRERIGFQPQSYHFIADRNFLNLRFIHVLSSKFILCGGVFCLTVRAPA